jgi:hypothetical protein
VGPGNRRRSWTWRVPRCWRAASGARAERFPATVGRVGRKNPFPVGARIRARGPYADTTVHLPEVLLRSGFGAGRAPGPSGSGAGRRVLLNDAARPFDVLSALFDSVAAAVEDGAGAGAVRPVTDTVKRVSGDLVLENRGLATASSSSRPRRRPFGLASGGARAGRDRGRGVHRRRGADGVGGRRDPDRSRERAPQDPRPRATWRSHARFARGRR